MSGSSVPKDKNKKVDVFEKLCTQIQNDLKVQIPTYIKKILLFNGFSNGLVLRTLSERDIDIMETVARGETYYKAYEVSDKSWETFYRLPWVINSDKEKFVIPLGHKRLLLSISDYFKQSALKQDPTHL